MKNSSKHKSSKKEDFISNVGLWCFRVQKNPAVNHLPLEHGLAIQTWTSNSKPNSKALVTSLLGICGSWEMPKNLDLKVSIQGATMSKFPFLLSFPQSHAYTFHNPTYTQTILSCIYHSMLTRLVRKMMQLRQWSNAYRLYDFGWSRINYTWIIIRQSSWL